MSKTETLPEIEIFTDGACRGNPGPGGWGALLRAGKHEKKISGGELKTTNNRMELTAAIKALEALKKPSLVKLTTDSKYLKDGMTKWLDRWIQNKWKNSERKEIKNKELWQKLNALAKKHVITWHWVRGHVGHPENELCDQLANEAIDNL